MPDGIADRAADVWEALLAVADAAGSEWPTRAREAAVTLVTDVTDGKGAKGSLGLQLLADIRDAFILGNTAKLSTVNLLEFLVGLDEAPWADLRGKPLDARGLSYRLAKYEVRPHPVRIGAAVVKGYEKTDLYDAFLRYLPPLEVVTDERVGSIKSKEINDLEKEDGKTAGLVPSEPVTTVTAVTEHCVMCGSELFLLQPGRDTCRRCELAQAVAS
jgi:hypothetical protein